MADTAQSVTIESTPLLLQEEEYQQKLLRAGIHTLSSHNKLIASRKSNKKLPQITQNVEQLRTPYGFVNITLQGNPKKPAILTYHDIGMNHSSCFNSFMSDSNMMELFPLFHWVHIDAPGQEEGAENFSENFVYPSVNELAEQVGLVVDHLQLSYIIGFGVGAGANVLTRFALMSPEKVRGLVLVNLTTDSLHWTDFSYLSDKLVSWLLKTNRLQDSVEKYLMTHSFTPTQFDEDLATSYHDYFRKQNPVNLSLLLESYSKRSVIATHLAKDTKCHWLFVLSGEGNEKNSQNILDFHSQLGPYKSTILELTEYGHLVLEECPDKVATSFRLFLQGLGHAVTLGVSMGGASKDKKTEDLWLQGVSIESEF